MNTPIILGLDIIQSDAIYDNQHRVLLYLRTGIRLPQKCTEITLHFKPTPHLMFPIEDTERLLRYSELTK